MSYHRNVLQPIQPIQILLYNTIVLYYSKTNEFNNCYYNIWLTHVIPYVTILLRLLYMILLRLKTMLLYDTTVSTVYSWCESSTTSICNNIIADVQHDISMIHYYCTIVYETRDNICNDIIADVLYIIMIHYYCMVLRVKQVCCGCVDIHEFWGLVQWHWTNLVI